MIANGLLGYSNSGIKTTDSEPKTRQRNKQNLSENETECAYYVPLYVNKMVTINFFACFSHFRCLHQLMLINISEQN